MNEHNIGHAPDFSFCFTIFSLLFKSSGYSVNDNLGT